VIDAFGHIAYSLIGAGMVMLARNNPVGWLVRLAGEFIWVVLGFFLGLSSVWLWGIVFMAIDTVGFYKWRKK
jgi:hypothetical protein